MTQVVVFFWVGVGRGFNKKGNLLLCVCVCEKGVDHQQKTAASILFFSLLFFPILLSTVDHLFFLGGGRLNYNPKWGTRFT